MVLPGSLLLVATKLAQREVRNVGRCLYMSQIVTFRYIHLYVYLNFIAKFQLLVIYLDFEANFFNSGRMQVKTYLLFG